MLIKLLTEHHKELMVSIGGMDFTKTPPQAIKNSFTFDGHTWSSGVVSDLPEAMGMQCLAKLDEDGLLGVGGYDEQFAVTKSTYFYNGKANQWTKGPSLRAQRFTFTFYFFH